MAPLRYRLATALSCLALIAGPGCDTSGHTPDDTPSGSVITPLSGGGQLITVSNDWASVTWDVEAGSDAILDRINGFRVDYVSDDSLDVGVVVSGGEVVSVVQEGGWAMSFETVDGATQGVFTSPNGQIETFDLPPGTSPPGGRMDADAARTAGSTSSAGVFYVETTCDSGRAYSDETSVTVDMYLESTGEPVFSQTINEWGPSDGRGFYEFRLPSSLTDTLAAKYLQDIKDNCEAIISPIRQTQWRLLELSCSLYADVTRNPAFGRMCDVFSLASELGLRDALTKPSSEGGFLLDCVLLDLILRAVPFDEDVSLVAYAWDPELGRANPRTFVYDSVDDLVNTSVEVQFEAPNGCLNERWNLYARCVGRTQTAFSLDFKITFDEDVRASGNGRDYDGSYLLVTMDGTYDYPSDVLDAVLTVDDEGRERVDSFQATLDTDDTGYIPLTLIRQDGTGCQAEARLVKSGTETRAIPPPQNPQAQASVFVGP